MGAPPRRLLALAPAALCLAPALAAAQGARELVERNFQKKRVDLLDRGGKRHLEYGLTLRRQGLATQAAEQIVLAVESSDGTHEGANLVLSLMRGLDDRFWWKKAPKPTRAGVAAYARAAAALERQDRRGRFDLALWAHANGLEEQAREETRALLLGRDEPLEFAADGSLSLDAGRVPKELARSIREGAIEINGRLYPRDAFLARLPGLEKVFEAASPELRVISTRSEEEAREFHALGTALFSLLEEDLGARPSRRLNLALLAERKVYEAYLDASNLAAHRVVSGLADVASALALVCAEGVSETALRGLALHELTHLFDRGSSRAVMPAWYVEGLAETYGGDGAFRWEAGKLEAGLPLSRARIDAVRERTLPLREFLAVEPLALWASDRDGAARYYAQSWAFLRYMSAGSGAETSGRFERWQTMCRGSAVGVEIGTRDGRNRRPADQLFTETLGAEAEALDAGFRAWLAKL